MDIKALEKFTLFIGFPSAISGNHIVPNNEGDDSWVIAYWQLRFIGKQT